MKKNHLFKILGCFLWIAFLPSCQDEFLDIKPDTELVVPTTLSDFQALLDHGAVMHRGTAHNLAEIGSDDYFIATDAWELVPQPEQRNGYIWAKDVYENEPVNDWDYSYRRILYANTVLEGLEKLSPVPRDQEQWNHVKGAALFYRSWAFYQLSQLFSKPYDPATAATDPGIPLRLEADINVVATRQTVEQTYRQMQDDLTQALNLLPVNPGVKERPGKAAALFLLAKIALQMEAYDQALEYANASLQLSSQLLDYNTLQVNARYPFPASGSGNPEIIFHSWMMSLYIFSPSRMQVDTVLYDLYAADDLRKEAYFFDNKGLLTFKGSYEGGSYFSTSYTTSELYLIKAECLARLGQEADALQVLNTLLQHRYATDTFQPLTPATTPDVLATILEERRKELVFRGVRWEDLRRLNKDPRFAKTLVRVLDGQRYELPPGDPRYVWPIPENVIEASGMAQNPR